MSEPLSKSSVPKAENPLINLLFNIVIPVLILNKLSAKIGALNALLLALAFPLGYLLWDLQKKKKWNFISLLGLLNVGLTGGLAVLRLEGPWFWVKEASFPLLIGIFVLGSAFTSKPFIKQMLFNSQGMSWELILEKSKQQGFENSLDPLLKKYTLWLSASFFLSAALNFILAYRIFVPIDLSLAEEVRSQLLNEQIAQMTQWSFPVIMVPSMIFLGLILFFLFRKLKILTGLDAEALMTSSKR